MCFLRPNAGPTRYFDAISINSFLPQPLFLERSLTQTRAGEKRGRFRRTCGCPRRFIGNSNRRTEVGEIMVCDLSVCSLHPSYPRTSKKLYSDIRVFSVTSPSLSLAHLLDSGRHYGPAGGKHRVRDPIPHGGCAKKQGLNDIVLIIVVDMCLFVGGGCRTT